MSAPATVESPPVDHRGSITRSEAAVIVALTVVGLVACLVKIGQSSLWLDEAFSVAGSGELTRSWTERGGSMGLYYSFLAVWTDEAGTTTWIRLPSAVFAAASVPFGYLVARRIGGRQVAVIATSLLVLSWGFVRYGQEARSYSLVLLLVSASWWCFVTLVDEPGPSSRRRRVVAYAVVTGLVGYAQPLGLLVVAPQALVVGLHHDRRAALRRATPGFLGAAVLTLPLVVLVVGANANPSWVQPLNQGQFEQLQVQLGGSVGAARWLAAAGWMLGLVVLLRRALDPSERHERWLAATPVLWFAVPIAALAAVSLVDPHFVARYLLAILPAACMLVAVAIVALPRPIAIVAYLALVALSVVGVTRLWDHPRQAWGELVAHVSDPADPALVLFADPELRVPFEHALLVSGRIDGVIPLAPPRQWGGLPRHLPAFSLDGGPPLDEAIWVVDWGHEPDDDPLGGRIAAIVAHPHFDQLCPASDAHFDGTLVAVRFEPNPGGC